MTNTGQYIFFNLAVLGSIFGILDINAYSNDDQDIDFFLCRAPNINTKSTGGIVTIPLSNNNKLLVTRNASEAKIPLTKYGTALLRHRWLKKDSLDSNSGRIVLGIAFIGGTFGAKKKFEKTAREWLHGNINKYLALEFDVAPETAQIRVSFDIKGGNYSQLGRSALLVEKNRPTMNIANATGSVILHEFGHALGLSHEHTHPESGIQWNKKVVKLDFSSSNGHGDWDLEKNLFHRNNETAQCVGDPSFNDKSIMIYPIKKSWTKNGFSAQPAKHITARDRACVLGLYRND